MQRHKYRANDPGLAWLRRLLREAVSQIDARATAHALAALVPRLRRLRGSAFAAHKALPFTSLSSTGLRCGHLRIQKPP
jgi:hypothetical protein